MRKVWMSALMMAGLGGAVRAEEAPSLTQYLQAQRVPIQLEQGRIQGAGADLILQPARAAPYLLIGEDHGFADVPQFVLALDQSLGAAKTDGLVLEIGPLAAERLRAAHRAGDLSKPAQQFPGSAAFVEWQDDLDMVAHWLDAGKAIAGVDQEFILSPRANLTRLLELAPKDADAEIGKALQTATQAEQKMMETGDFGLADLLHRTDADFAAWRAAFASAPNPEATQIIDALAESAQIYAWNSTDPARSNRERSRLMKREFMAAMTAAPGKRWMFRMGAYHVGRGLSPTGQFDLGNLVSELAESQGQTSLHLLVLANGGKVNRRLPILSDRNLEALPYDGPAELEGVTGKVFLEASKDQQGWAVYDLRPLRSQRALREQGGPIFAQLVYAYDFIVLIDQAKPARSLPAERKGP